MKLRLLALTTGLALMAGILAACADTTTNTNNARTNVTNLGANNANTGAVVVNANANANRWNANISREEYERDRSMYERGKDATETIGQGANDSWLWFKTRSALATTDDLRDSTINVDVSNDVVTLRGTVGSAAERSTAERVAKAIEGVKSVNNQLKVSPSDSATNQIVNGNTR